MNWYIVLQVAMLVDGFFTWTLVGQGLLALMAGSQRNENFVYRFFVTLTLPVTKPTRWILPSGASGFTIGAVTVLWLLALRLVVYMAFHYFGLVTPANSGAITPQ
ncbi:MAG: YggT family protein [Nitrospinae bacterium]|nr:YggT family protein [Nitrospinota bacterium]